jgi:uncharacterized protein YdhG (YjbR/CyaY superfamily)
MDRVEKYIDKRKSPQKEVCQKLRAIILETFPSIKEEMRWGVPSFDNGKFYLVALKDHVNFGYNDGGKKMKHLEIKSIKEIDTKQIVDLLKLVGRK